MNEGENRWVEEEEYNETLSDGALVRGCLWVAAGAFCILAALYALLIRDNGVVVMLLVGIVVLLFVVHMVCSTYTTVRRIYNDVQRSKQR